MIEFNMLCLELVNGIKLTVQYMTEDNIAVVKEEGIETYVNDVFLSEDNKYYIVDKTSHSDTESLGYIENKDDDSFIDIPIEDVVFMYIENSQQENDNG